MRQQLLIHKISINVFSIIPISILSKLSGTNVFVFYYHMVNNDKSIKINECVQKDLGSESGSFGSSLPPRPACWYPLPLHQPHHHCHLKLEATWVMLGSNPQEGHADPL